MAAAKVRKKNGRGNRLAILGLTLVIGVLAFSVGSRSRTLEAEAQDYAQQEERLQREIREEELRTQQLNQRKEYVTTNEYIEEVAREKLGLIDPNEVLLKEKE